jgi:hypothetical protein
MGVIVPVANVSNASDALNVNESTEIAAEPGSVAAAQRVIVPASEEASAVLSAPDLAPDLGFVDLFECGPVLALVHALASAP